MGYQYIVPLLISLASANAQGVKATVEAMGTSTLAETEILVGMNLHQQDILRYTKDISKKTAAILVLKEMELESLTATPQGIQETEPWKRAVTNVEYIVQYNTNTIALIDANRDLLDLPIIVLADITERTYSYFSDMETILRDGEDNMMSPTARYELIERINGELDELLAVSETINQAVRTIIDMSGQGNPDLTIDPGQPLQDTFDEIETLIRE